MAYADYEYYKTKYYGSLIPEEAFDRYAAQASRQIDQITAGMAGAYDDAAGLIKNAACDGAEIFYRFDQEREIAAKNAGKSSETVQSYSVSYRDMSQSLSYESVQKTVNQALYASLAATGLLYRGALLVY